MAVRAHTMVVARDPSTGAVLTSATVNVYTPGTVTPIGATIFDKSGNVLSNPLTSDPTTGLVDFYLAVAQEVDLVVAKSGYTTRTYSNVPVLDDASNELTALLTATGDILYASSANTPARLAIGATGVPLVGGATPAWGPLANSVAIPAADAGLTQSADNTVCTLSGLTAGGVYLVSWGIELQSGANAGGVAMRVTDGTNGVGAAQETLPANSYLSWGSAKVFTMVGTSLALIAQPAAASVTSKKFDATYSTTPASWVQAVRIG